MTHFNQKMILVIVDLISDQSVSSRLASSETSWDQLCEISLHQRNYGLQKLVVLNHSECPLSEFSASILIAWIQLLQNFQSE